tara:strand:- start:3904 stop:4995 length:1092 start_codon:yes stop_codon:yes gene_type:complete
MKFTYNEKELEIKRYPATTNRSLQPWAAADELMLTILAETSPEDKSIALLNDRFGFLATLLAESKPISVVGYKSQEKSLKMNLSKNDYEIDPKTRFSPLEKLPTVDIGLIKIPKSVDLFRLNLHQIHNSLSKNGVVLCGFMTRYFTPQLLEIAGEYFDVVEQSKAWKKARVLTLKGKKEAPETEFTNSLSFKEMEFKQYFGVFSSNNIDFATQYFIEQIKVNDNEKVVLDLACGNGVIAKSVLTNNTDIEIHLLDDSVLAIESAKLNLSQPNVHFHLQDTLEYFEDESVDLALSNPPFHFDHETNIEIALDLFKETHRCLTADGRFLMVASKHLNFKTHLDKIFTVCKIIAENEKFVVYECLK